MTEHSKYEVSMSFNWHINEPGSLARQAGYRFITAHTWVRLGGASAPSLPCRQTHFNRKPVCDWYVTLYLCHWMCLLSEELVWHEFIKGQKKEMFEHFKSLLMAWFLSRQVVFLSDLDIAARNRCVLCLSVRLYSRVLINNYRTEKEIIISPCQASWRHGTWHVAVALEPKCREVFADCFIDTSNCVNDIGQIKYG